MTLRDFKKPLTKGSPPKELRTLMLHTFNQPLTKGILPVSLEKLIIPLFTKKSIHIANTLVHFAEYVHHVQDDIVNSSINVEEVD